MDIHVQIMTIFNDFDITNIDDLKLFKIFLAFLKIFFNNSTFCKK